MNLIRKEGEDSLTQEEAEMILIQEEVEGSLTREEIEINLTQKEDLIQVEAEDRIISEEKELNITLLMSLKKDLKIKKFTMTFSRKFPQKYNKMAEKRFLQMFHFPWKKNKKI